MNAALADLLLNHLQHLTMTVSDFDLDQAASFVVADDDNSFNCLIYLDAVPSNDKPVGLVSLSYDTG